MTCRDYPQVDVKQELDAQVATPKPEPLWCSQESVKVRDDSHVVRQVKAQPLGCPPDLHHQYLTNHTSHCSLLDSCKPKTWHL